MKKLIIENKYDNKKLTRVLSHTYPNLSVNVIYKALRKKDILVNGKRITENIMLHENDELVLYITDEYLFPKPMDLNIIYEDGNILVINKPSGISVTNEEKSEELSLSDLVKTRYEDNKFIPLPCHRIDRNTSGIVLFAKKLNVLEFLLEKFELREINKNYHCIVVGILKEKKKRLEAFLFKDNKKSLVYVSDTLKKGYLPIITSYEVIDENKKKNISLLDVNIETGRTHQIRAHLAHIGFPILGDGKYGVNQVNREFGVNKQLLCAYNLKFNFKKCPEKFEYLNHMKFEIDDTHVRKYME